MIVYAEKTSLESVRTALDVVPKEKILGLVLNRRRCEDGAAYYPRHARKATP